MICIKCGYEFDYPREITYYSRSEMDYIDPPDYVCPHCGTYDYREEEEDFY